MTATLRLTASVGIATVTLALFGCPPPPNNNGGDGGITEPCDLTSGQCECVDDSECGDSQLFFCNNNTSLCEPSCRTKADCSGEVRGEFALPYCEGNLGCQCDEGTCVAALCSADADCGAGFACRNGQCVQAPAAATAQSCQITPDFAIVKAGETAKFWVSFWDASNTPVVLTDGITWTAATGRVTSPQPSGSSAVFTGGAPGAAEDAVQVQAGQASCVAKVVTLDPNVPAGQIRVTVVNELTGRPVTGGHVQVAQASNGNEVDVQPMNASGSTLLDLPNGADKTVTVTAYHAGYTYMSVAAYDATTGSRDLLIAMRRNQVDKYGGYKGTFEEVPSSANVLAGIASMSIPGAVTDLSVSTLLGYTVPTDVKIGTINQEDVPLPAGVYLKFAQETPIKGDIAALGVAGVCNAGTPGVTDVEQAIANGECGTRSAWALSGDVSLSELPIDAVTGGFDNIDFGKVLSRLIPVFKKFNSSVVRDVGFSLKDTPRDANNEPDFGQDTSHFVTQNHAFASVPLGFSFAVDVPSLPRFRDQPADGVLILGGADVPGRGVVPLGLGAGVNTDDTVLDQTDPQGGLDEPGLVLVRMAPTHSGIEGDEYVLFAGAVSLQSVNDPAAGLALSALYQRLENNRLAFDPAGANPTPLTGPFMNFPENARYNFVGSAQPGFSAGRQFRFVSGQDLSAASAVRVQFTDNLGHRWQVVASPTVANTGFVVPVPPSPYLDRTFYVHNTNGSRSTLTVQAFRLASGGTQVPFTAWVEMNSTNMDRLGNQMQSFSVIEYGRPYITWVAPTNGGTIAPGASIKLQVRNFRVGTTMADDGVVKVSFTNGPAECTELTLSQYSVPDDGELTAPLPTGCAGQDIKLTAQLYNNQGQAVAPPVVYEVTADIQP